MIFYFVKSIDIKILYSYRIIELLVGWGGVWAVYGLTDFYGHSELLTTLMEKFKIQNAEARTFHFEDDSSVITSFNLR